MDMEIWYILALAVVAWAAFKLGQLSILFALKQDVRERILNGKLSASDAVREVVDLPPDECVFSVERHQGQYYAFADSGEFLAQGPDFRSMFESIKRRFPGRNFRVQRLQAELTEEEQQRMVDAIVKTFGGHNDKT